MFDTLQTIFVALVTFAIVVAFHEYGHIWMARRAGVKVLRFSIGFGRPLFRWQGKDDTEYVIAAIPLGGYVRMADERDGEIAEEDLPRAHNRQSVSKRIAIAAAGPIAASKLIKTLPGTPHRRRRKKTDPQTQTREPASTTTLPQTRCGRDTR